jgi:hypothetical protein
MSFFERGGLHGSGRGLASNPTNGERQHVIGFFGGKLSARV